MTDNERRSEDYRIDLKRSELKHRLLQLNLKNDGAIANEELQIAECQKRIEEHKHAKKCDSLKFDLEDSSLFLEKERIALEWAREKKEFSE